MRQLCPCEGGGRLTYSTNICGRNGVKFEPNTHAGVTANSCISSWHSSNRSWVARPLDNQGVLFQDLHKQPMSWAICCGPRLWAIGHTTWNVLAASFSHFSARQEHSRIGRVYRRYSEDFLFFQTSMSTTIAPVAIRCLPTLCESSFSVCHP